MTVEYIRLTLPNGHYAQWLHHGDDRPALVSWYTSAGFARPDLTNETSAEAAARLTTAHPDGVMRRFTAEQAHAGYATPVLDQGAVVELIARRAPIGHPHYRGPRVQVWRADPQGDGIEVCQYLEQLDYAGTTAENVLTAAGYALVGVWRPEDESGTIERLPLRCDARGFLRRMQRLYSPGGAGNIAHPDAAAVVRDVLAALLLGPHAHDPASYRTILRAHLTAARAGTGTPARPGWIDPRVSAHVADTLARILRTLETEFAPTSDTRPGPWGTATSRAQCVRRVS